MKYNPLVIEVDVDEDDDRITPPDKIKCVFYPKLMPSVLDRLTKLLKEKGQTHPSHSP